MQNRLKYGRFRNDSVTSSDYLIQNLAMSGKVAATPVTSTSPPAVPPLAHPCPSLRDAHLSDEQEATTTFCMLIPKMSQWKFSNPSGFLSRSPSTASKDLTSAKPGPLGEVSGPIASLATVLNSCDPVCSTPCSLQVMSRFRSAVAAGGGKKNRAEDIKLAGEEWNRKGSFINKPSQGWLHPDENICGPGVSYIVRYMGCIEVLRSMRSLDFNTRTQVTREAINRLYEAVPGVKGAWKKKPPNKVLFSVLGKSNLRFAGMSIAINISVDGLNLLIPTTRQIIANHHMQSISFASGGDTDMADYVAYVAKDPVNQRACHILECCDGLAQNVISTIGQAFELRFKQYLHSPPKLVTPLDRITGTKDSTWGDEEDSGEHDYYNSIPGKEPPLGGVIDSRLRFGTPLSHIHTQPPTANSITQVCSPAHRDQNLHPGPHWEPDLHKLSDGKPPGSQDYEDHMYVNMQSMENWESDSARQRSFDESPKKDLFDMRPFEDALKLHEAGPFGTPPLEDQWPSPPTRKAPIAPTEEQLKREPWYHGRMSRKDAEKLLQMDGDFLVRDSMTNPGQYVLTGMDNGQPKHLLLVDPEGVVRTKDVLFESISHLISYHLQNELPIVAVESEVHLRQIVRKN
ncbi:SHC-transforming protein 2 isoform X2 [Protopterus annectens]|uniref:SHC-transforming protein 2 isoform X2 n=1 Tax=Protopterus annectens TaxID=7888 RepID=UPI001CFA5FC9|nr:SHC-transforming protein 2 isoform X2 [Protopterus annectens]